MEVGGGETDDVAPELTGPVQLVDKRLRASVKRPSLPMSMSVA